VRVHATLNVGVHSKPAGERAMNMNKIACYQANVFASWRVMRHHLICGVKRAQGRRARSFSSSISGGNDRRAGVE
jgi:hypothetical protein